MLNKQSQSYHLNLHISHPQKAEFTLQTLPCVYEMNTWLQQNPARSLSAFQNYWKHYTALTIRRESRQLKQISLSSERTN